MNTNPVTSNVNGLLCKHYCSIKCMSWSSIIIGALVAVGLSFLLNLFSTSIGLSIYKVNSDDASTLAIGGMLGFAIGIIAVMFLSGWVAGYFGRSHCQKKYCGALYGFTTWSLALILMIILTTPLSQFVTNYKNYLSNTKISTTLSSNKNDTNEATVLIPHNEVTLGDLSKGAFVLFLMFFLSALASTCGGHLGVFSCQNKECCTTGKCSQCN